MTPWPGGWAAARAQPASTCYAPGVGVVKISAIRCRRRSIRTSPTPSRRRRRARRRTSCRRAGRPRAAVPTGRDPEPGRRAGRRPARRCARSTSTAISGLAAVTSAVEDERSSWPRVDHDDVVADPLELAEQVRGDQHRDAELGADPADQPEHVVAAGRVEAVGRLVEQHQLRVVDQRLGELDPLLHAGRVAADRPVPLLVEPDVAQRVGGALPGRGPRQPGHPGHVHDELGGRHVRRQAVVLGHVARPARGSRRPRWRRRGRAPWPGRTSAGSSPSTILISVDLPAPLAPISPTTPGSTSTLSSETAVTAPYRLVSASVWIIGMGPTLRRVTPRFAAHTPQVTRVITISRVASAPTTMPNQARPRPCTPVRLEVRRAEIRARPARAPRRRDCRAPEGHQPVQRVARRAPAGGARRARAESSRRRRVESQRAGASRRTGPASVPTRPG